MEHAYPTLQSVLEDEAFPRADTALRRGRHIDRDEAELYGFLCEAQALLEPFYRRFGMELVRLEDGYFYLLPVDPHVSRRRLTPGAMLAGQALALLYLDPSLVEQAGVIPRSRVLELLGNLVGEDRLLHALNPRRRHRTDTAQQETIRRELDKGLRALEEMGFLDRLEDDALRLRLPLLRFADPVRTLADPAGALREMLSRGEIEVGDEEEDEDE